VPHFVAQESRMLANRVDQVVKPRYSLRASLLWLLAACILPAASVSVSLAIAHYRCCDQIHHGTFMLARQVAAELDRELAGIESACAQPTSALIGGDLVAFHARASAALASRASRTYVLVDRLGRQI
jgi:hypothetical protein